MMPAAIKGTKSWVVIEKRTRETTQKRIALVATHSQLEGLVYTPHSIRSRLQVSNAFVRPLTVE